MTASYSCRKWQSSAHLCSSLLLYSHKAQTCCPPQVPPHPPHLQSILLTEETRFALYAFTAIFLFPTLPGNSRSISLHNYLTIVPLLPSLLSCTSPSALNFLPLHLFPPTLALPKFMRSISDHLWNTYNVPSILLSDSISLCFYFSIMSEAALAESTQ